MKEPEISNGDFLWLTKCALGGQHKRLLPIARVEGVVVLVAPDELAARPRHLGDEAFPLVRVRVQLHEVVERGERDRASDLVRPRIDQQRYNNTQHANQAEVTHVSAMLGVPGSLVFRFRLRG